MSHSVQMDGSFLAGNVWWIGILGLVLGVAGSMLTQSLFQKALNRRLRALRNQASQIAASDSGDFLAPPDDELGALAASLQHAESRTRSLTRQVALQEARRDTILAGLTEGVMAVSADRHVVFFNQAFAQAVGARFRAVEGMTLLELVRDPDLLGMISQSIASGVASKRSRLRLTAAEGRSFDAQVCPIAASAGGGAIVVLFEKSDIERVERVRKDFVVNVSHELRTPLAAIQGYAETLLDGALEDPASARGFVEIISRQAGRLQELTQDLLALADLESARLVGEPQALSVKAVVESALRVVEVEAELRGVTVVRGTMEESLVLANRIYFEQAIVNLLHNAIRFNHVGGEVRIECRREPDNRVDVVVEDNGIGIPSMDLPRIFERFFRVDRARSRNNGGSGLGLAIARHAIEQMGGTITVESQLGHGSRFSVSLQGLSSMLD